MSPGSVVVGVILSGRGDGGGEGGGGGGGGGGVAGNGASLPAARQK